MWNILYKRFVAKKYPIQYSYAVYAYHSEFPHSVSRSLTLIYLRGYIEAGILLSVSGSFVTDDGGASQLRSIIDLASRKLVFVLCVINTLSSRVCGGFILASSSELCIKSVFVLLRFVIVWCAQLFLQLVLVKINLDLLSFSQLSSINL